MSKLDGNIIKKLRETLGWFHDINHYFGNGGDRHRNLTFKITCDELAAVMFDCDYQDLNPQQMTIVYQVSQFVMEQGAQNISSTSQRQTDCRYDSTTGNYYNPHDR